VLPVGVGRAGGVPGGGGVGCGVRTLHCLVGGASAPEHIQHVG